jgi:signal transduction histidine kinase/ligand-binding sensor domain-containing protein
MRRPKLCAFFLLMAQLACCACAFALNPSLDVTQYAHSTWKLSEGFATGEIHIIAQSPDGYLWLATEAGLLRFDGVRTVEWTPPAGEHLPSNDVRYVVAARDGTLWIGTAKGLVSWGHGVLTHYPELDGHDVAAVLEDYEGTVWAAGVVWERALLQPGKLCAIKNGAMQCYGSDGIFSFGVTAMYEDSRGSLWLGAGNGIWRWKPGTPKQYVFPGVKDPVLSVWAFAFNPFVEDEDGTLLVSCPPLIRAGSGCGQISRIVGEQLKPFPLPYGVQRFNRGTLLRDRQGGLWIGTQDNGIVHVHHGSVDVFSESDGLSGNRVESLFEDREGSIWVATANGVDRFRENTVSSISVKQGLSTPYAVCILASQSTGVWIGTADGLNRWNDGQITIYRRPPASGAAGSASDKPPSKARRAAVQEIISSELPDNYITSLYEDVRGRIWIATRGGLAYFENGLLTRVKGVHITFASHIAGDNAGNLWIPNMNDAVYHFKDGKLVDRIPWSKLGASGSFSNQIVSDQHGGLWFASWSGLVTYFKDGQMRASYSSVDGLGAGRVNALRLVPSGVVWAATDGGLSRIKDGHVKTLTSKNGLPCDVVQEVTEDNARAFWLKTACGLVRIASSELDAWLADSQHRIVVTVFDTSDGVRSHAGVYNFGPRTAKTADGKLWFLPLDGVMFLDPQRLPLNHIPPPVHIERIVADGKFHAASAGLRLPSQVRDVWIDYTALTFVAPEKVRFRYMLEGQDPDWKEVVNDRQARYSNLPPRKYRFRVTACNNSGVWNEEGAFLDFSVAPAYYQTTWFRLSFVAVFLALLWGLYQLRLQQLAREFNMRLEERVGERTRIARDLHDTLLQSFHGVLLHLQTVSNELATGNTKEKIDGVIDQAEQAIVEGRGAVQGLRASTIERNDLALAIRTLGEELAAADTRSCRPELTVQVEGVARNLHPIVRDEAYRITCEAMRNAFRHADAKQIEVEIHYDDRQLRARVRDNGKGIDPQLTSDDRREGHFGLRGMRERAKLIGGKLTVWSELDSGTEVELSIPAGRAYLAPPRRRRSWFVEKLARRSSDKDAELKS